MPNFLGSFSNRGSQQEGSHLPVACFPVCISGDWGKLEVIVDNISSAPVFWLICHVRSGVEFSTSGVMSVLKMFSVLYLGLRDT